MVDNYYAYVQNRMRQMGYDKFSVEPVFINEAVLTEKTINAQNQFYYLISETVAPSLEILSDSNIFTDGVNFGTFNFNYLQEFTGSIEISQAVPIQLEFIRVIPEKGIL